MEEETVQCLLMLLLALRRFSWRRREYFRLDNPALRGRHDEQEGLQLPTNIPFVHSAPELVIENPIKELF